MPSTMNSFAMSVLLRNEGAAPIPQPLRFADDWEQRHLFRSHLAEILGIGVLDVDRLLREMAVRWQSLDPELKDEKVDEKVRDKFVGIFGLHRQIFGYTLLSELPELLRGVLETYGNVEGVGHDLMLVDEYQDLNACDLEVLRLLSVRESRILAVGDDDQSIYSFRRRTPKASDGSSKTTQAPSPTRSLTATGLMRSSGARPSSSSAAIRLGNRATHRPIGRTHRGVR